MIDFQRLSCENRMRYETVLFSCLPRSCEYSFVNLFCWGLQQAAFVDGCVVFFSHFDGRSVYPYPIGGGDRRAALERIFADAAQRGIPCRLVGMKESECAELEAWFPGMFRFRWDRDSFDYVYDLWELAELKGRKFQKKRNHVNRFCQEHPDWKLLPLDDSNLPAVREMAAEWYICRKGANPERDFLLESIALNRALHHFDDLGMEGIVLLEGERILAFALGSRLSADTFDIHFEKARGDSDGAYAMINREFARWLGEKHPELRYLNREDDMGLPGLRKAKLSYNPHHLEEKYWAYQTEACFPEAGKEGLL